MKKSIATLLALLMLLSLMAGCASTPATTPSEEPTNETPAEDDTTPAEEPAPDEPAEEPAEEPTEEPAEEISSVYPICAPGEITVEWFAGDKTNAVLQEAESDFSQNVFWQWVEEVTGVQIEWNILSGDTFREQFSLMMVAEEYPDIATQMINYISTSPDQTYDDGILVDLNEYAELIPNYLAMLDVAVGGYKGALSDAGRLLGFWQLRDRQQPAFLGYYVRQDWLDDLGMEAPTTIDEWRTTLEAFRDNKTGGKGPMTYDAGGLSAGNWLSRAFGVNSDINTGFMVQRDGVVACTAVEDGFRSFLETMAGGMPTV